MKNKYKGVHFSKFSKIAGLLSTTLLKKKCFTDIFQLFGNIYTNIYFAEQVSLATPESISYRSIKNSVRTIAPEENCPPVRVRVWVRVRFSVGGQLSSGAIVLEPLRIHIS